MTRIKEILSQIELAAVNDPAAIKGLCDEARAVLDGEQPAAEASEPAPVVEPETTVAPAPEQSAAEASEPA